MQRLGLLVATVLLLLSAALAPACHAAPERRVALVIGNGAYRHVNALRNPDSDARLMAETLRRLGFSLVGGAAQLDLDRAGMEAAIRQFRAAIAPGAVAFFYYSGHGVQVDGSNYLVPVSAAPASERDIPVQMVAADLVLQDMADAGAALNVMVLDACRNNPFAMAGTSGTRGLRPGGTAAVGTAPAAGLAEMHAPRATLISFATQPGDVAFDGGPGMKDSPYTTALAGALRVPELDIVRAFNRAGIEVGRLTGQRQEPWLAISPIEDEVFLAGPAGPGTPPPPLPAEATEHTMTLPRATQVAPPPATPATVALGCPRAGLRAVRDGAVPVLYEGSQAGSADLCLAEVGGVPQMLVRGIWPANWPGAAAAASAMNRVLHEPAGSEASFRVSESVPGLRDTMTSETWQFTLTNEGSGTLSVAGAARPVARLRWDERNLSHPYRARAEIAVDASTGAVLSQTFRVLVGGVAASYDFWSAYRGGLASVPDFRVTAFR